MVDRCPNDDCRDELHGRINERIKKADFYKVLAIFLCVLGIMIGLIMESYSQGVRKREEAIQQNITWDRSQEDRLQACERNNAVTNSELMHIKERLGGIESGNNAILRELKKLGQNGQ